MDRTGKLILEPPRTTISFGVWDDRAGRWRQPPLTVGNTYLLPGWFDAAKILFGVGSVVYQPYSVIGLGSGGAPSPADHDKRGLDTPIFGGRLQAGATSLSNLIALGVTFSGQNVRGIVREAALFNTLDETSTSPALFRYVFPVALTLDAGLSLPVQVNVHLSTPG